MSAERVTYLDSSAIVKLVVREQESAPLRRYLRRRRPLVSSALARTEVLRALMPLGRPALERGVETLARIELVRVNDQVLAAAGRLEPPELRNLDAIHLATASLFEGTLGQLVTYDHRMAQAGGSQGWTVVAPS